ncbi:MAG TPA: pilus assembly protein TadG-related protein [Pirellulaceae bacterium]|nr:pilus assembly protein TadG-related protein [Pirellulaceae bacterium]
MRLTHPNRLHADERGTISLISVFTLLLLTVLMGMVINVGRQVDNKVKLQNAADASTYSGGVVLARGMNTLAFSNHLLCDVFAMTAFLREGSQRNAESLTPEILATWQRMSPDLANSGFSAGDRQPILNAPPNLLAFTEVGPAIDDKLPLEQEMVRTYSDWMQAVSLRLLPTFEQILEERMIPQFQSDVMNAIPAMAQLAADEIAKTHGPVAARRATSSEVPSAVLWRGIVDPVAGAADAQSVVDPYLRTLPVVDPVNDYLPMSDQMRYQQIARQQREQAATRYLRAWNSRAMQYFDEYAKMSQFGRLWRGFTCGQLKKLLEEEYPDSNLPFVIRYTPADVGWDQTRLDRDYMFIGVAYRPQIAPAMGKVFQTRLESDAQAYAQGLLFIPGGNWDLMSQYWNFHLVPAMHESVGPILQTQPQVQGVTTTATSRTWTLPNLGSTDETDIRRITTH